MPADTTAATPVDAAMPDVEPSQIPSGTETAVDAAAAVPPPALSSAGVVGSLGEPPEERDVSRQYRSKVNGLGMWSAWERNFSNKLKACLDLVDNAVDAALWDSDDEEDEEEENEGRPLTERERWRKQSGNIHISTEKHRLAMVDSDEDDDDERDGDLGGGDQKDVENSNGAPKPKPVIIHDVLGPQGGEGNNPDATEKTDDFRLIDDENTLCLHNDCIHPVKDLRKILDVYNSDKTESAIGENGVGVKQAAAAMSDLSIVVTTRIDEEPLLMDYGNFEGGANSVKRIRKCLVSVGVLAKKMQSTESCVIPSWTLPIEFNIDEDSEKKASEEKKKDGVVSGNGVNDNDDEMDEMDTGEDFTGDTCKPVLMRALSKITSNNKLLGKTMREFGGAAAKNRRKYGIQRLAKHIELMVSSSKKKNKKLKPPHPHQYLMILHKFGKHQQHAKNGVDDTAMIAKRKNELDDLLRDLAEEMPRTYLHIPPAPHFKVRVNRELLKFQYWERHLVELHQIPLIVDRRNDFRTAEDWLIPENDNDTYEIKVSIGFDPVRANPYAGRNSADDTSSFIGGQACSLLIFSRISGRLFLKHDDARGVLRLNNSGTSYCQGLTVIVDDFEGHLPLTPTKESLAFGMEEYGKIHERNLYAWLGALANVYWTQFHSLFKTKKALGLAIRDRMDRVNLLKQKDAVDLPTLRYGSFSTVESLHFSRERVRDSIRPYKSELTKWTSGPSTLIKLTEPSKPKPKKKPNTTKKRKATDFAGLDGYDSDGNDLMDGAPPSSVFENNPSAGDEQAKDPAEQAPPRLDGRPRRATKEPIRFEELPEEPKRKLKKGKKSLTKVGNGKGEKDGDARLKKRLKDIEAELFETQLELNASKATCDDLQMQLEEVEHTGTEETSKISELKTVLTEAEKKHELELQKVKDEHAKQLEALMARLKELEGKSS